MSRRLHRLVTMLLGTALVASGCSFSIKDMPLPGGTDVGEDPIRVTVMFRNVLDLVPQSTVKMNDVDVGMVEDVELRGQAAAVTLELRRGIDLPDNARARIRQTSLLGEKFVSLQPPQQGARSEPLQDGDVIPLERTGRNPEVEEVLGAISLLLNGGGVAQLNTITDELNNALEGREGAARSVLRQADQLMGQLDDNKGQIVRALEGLNRLSASLRRQEGTINAALRELPSALDSINRQREDLVRMLRALNRLGDVGVRVIRNSEEATTQALRQLAPVLEGFARADDSLAKSLQVFLTYPFVDEAVGRDPQVARNLHMGDYTNLSVRLDINLEDATVPGLPQEVCTPFHEVDSLEGIDLAELCDGARARVQRCLQALADNDLAAARRECGDLMSGGLQTTVNDVCSTSGLDGLVSRLPGLCSDGSDSGTDGGGGPVPDLGLGGSDGSGGVLGGLGRAPYDQATPQAGQDPRGPTMGQLVQAYDPALVKLIVPGMVVDQ